MGAAIALSATCMDDCVGADVELGQDAPRSRSHAVPTRFSYGSEVVLQMRKESRFENAGDPQQFQEEQMEMASRKGLSNVDLDAPRHHLLSSGAEIRKELNSCG
ncbi:hypothetical protein CERZMDRAFT_100113 [Cercospora zeae-maydis SCOH1-5]|uniref:Uncharacterized protein n=1 Tax=Cercospora zeae-maydis SCOH1-5 TaxID=717836 RepID=A0A6A6F824_9PEZI|nr:hypothetical protein CERZMDRAFT_100113 [Cercospora zeae-maydis SCOH1-5]